MQDDQRDHAGSRESRRWLRCLGGVVHRQAVPATLPFLRELDLSAGFAVCSNGAVLINAATGLIVEQVVFDLRDPIAVLLEQLPGAIFVAENPGVGVRATGRVDDAYMHHGQVELVDVDELAGTSTTRLAVHWPGRSARRLTEVPDRRRPSGRSMLLLLG